MASGETAIRTQSIADIKNGIIANDFAAKSDTDRLLAHAGAAIVNGNSDKSVLNFVLDCIKDALNSEKLKNRRVPTKSPKINGQIVAPDLGDIARDYYDRFIGSGMTAIPKDAIVNELIENISSAIEKMNQYAAAAAEKEYDNPPVSGASDKAAVNGHSHLNGYPEELSRLSEAVANGNGNGNGSHPPANGTSSNGHHKTKNPYPPAPPKPAANGRHIHLEGLMAAAKAAFSTQTQQAFPEEMFRRTLTRYVADPDNAAKVTGEAGIEIVATVAALLAAIPGIAAMNPSHFMKVFCTQIRQATEIPAAEIPLTPRSAELTVIARKHYDNQPAPKPEFPPAFGSILEAALARTADGFAGSQYAEGAVRTAAERIAAYPATELSDDEVQHAIKCAMSMPQQKFMQSKTAAASQSLETPQGQIIEQEPVAQPEPPTSPQAAAAPQAPPAQPEPPTSPQAATAPQAPPAQPEPQTQPQAGAAAPSSDGGSAGSYSRSYSSISSSNSDKNRWDREHAGKLAIGGGILTAIGAALGLTSSGKAPEEGQEKKSGAWSWIIGAVGLGAAAWGIYNLAIRGKAPGQNP